MATRTLSLHAAPDAAFPLFGPLGERAWAGERWNPEILWSPGDGDAEGMVFRAVGSLWVNIRLDRDEHVAEYLHCNGQLVTRIRVALAPRAGGGSFAEVRYDWVAVTEEGNALVAEKVRNAPASLDWEDAVNAALATPSRT